MKRKRVDVYYHSSKASSSKGELKKCSTCDGTGRVGAFRAFKCDVCEGKGWIRV